MKNHTNNKNVLRNIFIPDFKMLLVYLITKKYGKLNLTVIATRAQSNLVLEIQWIKLKLV